MRVIIRRFSWLVYATGNHLILNIFKARKRQKKGGDARKIFSYKILFIMRRSELYTMNKLDNVRMLNASEQGLVVEFGTEVSPEINAQVQQLSRAIISKNLPEIIEVVPTYRSLMIYFDPIKLSRNDLIKLINELLSGMQGQDAKKSGGRVVSVPVCYGGEYGPDLGFVAEHNGLTKEEVIEIHTSRPYLVYMLGFTPGFPYLGGMSEKIATPRLATPRVKIPEGSVGIAGTQTGFYPIESPGGWQLVGRTPIKAFDPKIDKPFMFDSGDYLHFKAISEEEFVKIRKEVEAGTYTPEITSLVEGEI